MNSKHNDKRFTKTKIKWIIFRWQIDVRKQGKETSLENQEGA